MSRHLAVGMPVWVLTIDPTQDITIAWKNALKTPHLALITAAMWNETMNVHFWSWEYYDQLTGIPTGMAQSGYDNKQPFFLQPAFEFRPRVFLERIPRR